jgi:hypothetical protein
MAKFVLVLVAVADTVLLTAPVVPLTLLNQIVSTVPGGTCTVILAGEAATL